MKLTHKAIARMAGYRVEYCYGLWVWVECAEDVYHTHAEKRGQMTELLAWEACCKENGLVEEE